LTPNSIVLELLRKSTKLTKSIRVNAPPDK